MEERYRRGWIRWMDTFQICKTQIEKSGDKPLRADLKGANGILLKAWVTNNRILYRKGKLTEEQRDLLDSIHIFDVKFRKESCRKRQMSAAERKWLACYEFCREMLQKAGDKALSADLKTPDGSLLMHWVTLNRQYYEQEILPQDRREMLESIGILKIRFAKEKPEQPEENTLPKKWLFDADEDWLTDFNTCRNALAAAGDSPLPPDIMATDGRPLRKWCERNQIRYMRGHLSQKCCEMLDSIQIFDVLCTDGDARWYATYLLCKEAYESEHMIPSEWKTEDGRSLLGWYYRNRSGKLSAVRRRLMESAGLISAQQGEPEQTGAI